MRYCAVKSCKYFKGTNKSVKVFRWPQHPDMAKRWQAAIGIGDNEGASTKWCICCEHFKDEDFERKDKSRLRPQAIPSIKLNAVDSMDYTDYTDTVIRENNAIQTTDGKIDCSSSEMGCFDANCQNTLDGKIIESCHETSEMDPNSSNELCEGCASKSSIIEKQNNRISELEALLKKCRNKVYYLDTTKTKLASSLLELKNQQIINAKQYQIFEVHFNIIHCLAR